MTRNPLIIVVGMTGVGKTSIIDRAVEQVDRPVEYLSYGTLLLEEGQRRGLVHDRDEITELNPDEYDDLQSYTAEQISLILNGDANKQPTVTDDTIYLLDTHATLDTPYGYRPGLSNTDVEVMNPDQLVFVEATPTEIYNRRASDDSRDRERTPQEQIDEQQRVARQMATSFAGVARSPIQFIQNTDQMLDRAVEEFVPLLARTQ